MPEHSDVHADKPGKCPRCGMTLIPVMVQPKPAQATNTPASTSAPLPPKLYTCPMAADADVVSDKPGKCPKCEMKLVPTSTVTHGKIAEENWRKQHASGRLRAAQPCLSTTTEPNDSYAQRHHRFLAEEQVHRPAGDACAWCSAAFTRCATSRWTPSRTCRTCRSSSTPSGRGRRRRSCRTRSPIPSPPRCSRCRETRWCAAIRSTASRSSM